MRIARVPNHRFQPTRLRRHLIPVLPKPYPIHRRLRCRHLILKTLQRRLLIGVLAIPSSQPCIELCQSHVFPVDVDSADQPPLAVDLVTVGFRLFAECKFCQVLAGDVSKCNPAESPPGRRRVRNRRGPCRQILRGPVFPESSGFQHAEYSKGMPDGLAFAYA